MDRRGPARRRASIRGLERANPDRLRIVGPLSGVGCRLAQANEFRRQARIEKGPWRFAGAIGFESVTDSTLLDGKALAQLGTAEARRELRKSEAPIWISVGRQTSGIRLGYRAAEAAYGWQL